jgi:hypothetical protein
MNTTSRDDFEFIRQEQLDNYYRQFNDGKDYPLGYPEFYHALAALSRAALDQSVRRNLDRDRFIDLLRAGFGVIGTLQEEMVWPDKDGKFALWSHQPGLLTMLQKGVLPTFYRATIEGLVTSYIKLPYRSIEIDRLFVDLLMAMEIAAFVDQMSIYILPKWQIGSAAARFTVNIVFWGGLTAIAQGLGFINGTWAMIGYFAAIVIGFLDLKNFGRAGVKVRDLTGTMLLCYNAMKSAGPISAAHIREMLASSAQKGVVWPAPLFALIDDVLARGGKL